MVKLANMLSRLNPAKILVIGDMLLDAYTIGKARRISPEAPVAIVNVQQEDYRPGGAGNVILNLLSLGANVSAMGRLGDDWAGHQFREALVSEGVETDLIISQKSYRTPVKNRIIADNQQIVRIDHEQIVPLDSVSERTLIEQLPQVLQGVKVVAISDYGKGFLTPVLISAIMEHSAANGITVITDPKGHHFAKYKGTTIIKPNLSEAYIAANLPNTAPLEEAARVVLQQTGAELLMVTRSEAGISLFDNHGNRFDFPVHAKAVKDVTGAGDTVLAMLAHAVANQLSYGEAAQLCNVAAGIAIEHVGCARVSLSHLALRLFEQNQDHKIFDQEHLFVLKEVLKQESYQLLILSQTKDLTPALYQSIKSLAAQGQPLLLYLDQIDPKETFIEMLASLREVSFILLHLDSLKEICQCSAPRTTYRFDDSCDRFIRVDWKEHSYQTERKDDNQCSFSMGTTAKS